MPNAFPPNFLWGAASSAYQIEGAATADGRGPSIWDDFCHTPGKVWQDNTGDTACDHYHRWPEDVALMKSLNLQAYRFSISWTRILPNGIGPLNQKGVDFYSRLTDALLAANIRPFATLFHWDSPSALYAKGGWRNPESPKWFADYSAVIADALADRITDWMTLNEPQVFLKFGLGDGTNAPGLKLPLADQLRAAHHALLAHGRSVQALRAHAKQPLQIGFAPVCVVKYPVSPAHDAIQNPKSKIQSPSPADLEAARRATFAITEPNLWNNTWFYDPIFRGQYPEDGLRLYGDAVPNFPSSDLALINQPTDFIGLNIYTGDPVRAGPDGSPQPVPRETGHPLTAFRWTIDPDSLHYGPRFVSERYKVPVYITENGLSNVDWPDLDGHVRDPQRIDFTRRYLLALHDAIAAGADIRGYFHWSLMDNFEWAAGYKERFGLIYIDYASQRRIPKDSAAWYARVIQTNGASLGDSPL
jgi:beta-glucosidase